MSCPSPAPVRRVRLKLQMHRQVFTTPPSMGNGKKKGQEQNLIKEGMSRL